MTSTDELRRLLDERGAEWKRGKTLPDYTVWKDADGREYDAAVSFYGEGILVGGLTPEQAIAATLGSDRDQVLERIEQLESIVRDLAPFVCADDGIEDIETRIRELGLLFGDAS